MLSRCSLKIDFGRGVGKELVGQRLTKRLAETAGKIDGDLPVVARFARRRNSGANTGDAPLGVGHRSFLFAPRCRWQQQIGVFGGIGIGVGFLQHDEFGLLQGSTNFGLVRH